jgi:hypothetical protein
MLVTRSRQQDAGDVVTRALDQKPGKVEAVDQLSVLFFSINYFR